MAQRKERLTAYRASLVRSTALTGALVAMPALLAAASGSALALPQGPQVVSGSASFSQSGNQLDVTEQSSRLIIDWSNFNLNTGESVVFLKSGSIGGSVVNEVGPAGGASSTRRAVTKIARATADLVGLRREIRDDDVVIDPRFAGPDYGLPDKETIAAIRLSAQLEAMLTDPVYEGKSMAGLIAMARSGEIARGSKVLYVHLGGAPALNAYHKAFD
jgi:hypothetical protein